MVSPPLDIDLRVLWLTDVIGSAESLVARDADARSVRELAGRRIATPFGSTAHYSTLSALREAGIEDEVVLLGRQGDESISAETLAGKIGSINYEVICRIHPQIPRIVV